MKENKTSRKTPMIGGSYSFVKNDDGTFNILDVPIFAELEEGVRGNQEDIGFAWMQLAIIKAKDRRDKEQYLAPLHLNHHGSGETLHAGFIMPTHIDKINHDGKQIDALFADLLRIPAEQFEKIKKGSVPYRSVEIHDFDKPEIASLALMEDEVPFFRLPMTSLGEELETREFSDNAPMVGMRSTDVGACILFNYKGGDLMAKRKAKKFQDEDEDKKEEMQAEDEEEKEEMAEVTEDEKKEDDDENLADDEDEKVELAEDAGPSMSEVMGVLMAIADKLGIEIEKADEIVEEEPEVQEGAPAELSAKKAGGYEGRLMAIESKFKAQEKAIKVDSMVQKAVESLSDWHVSDETKATIKHYASKGSKELKIFMAEFKRSARKEAPSSMSDFDNALTDGDSKEILSFSALGHKAVELARQKELEYEQLASVGLASFSKDDFVTREMKREGFEIK